MDKISAVIEKYIQPVAAKLSTQRQLRAIQNSFLAIIPFMTIGSFALIFITPVMDYTKMSAGFGKTFMHAWSQFATFASPALGTVYNVCMGMIAVYIAFALGYFLAKDRKMNTILPIFVTTASFLITAIMTKDGTISTAYFSSTGLFTAIIVCTLAFEFYRFLIEHKIGRIKISGAGVPEAIADSIGNLFPTAIVLLVVSIVAAAFYSCTGKFVPELVALLVSPLTGLVNSFGGVMFLCILVMLFWWFGIHDSVITGPLTPFLVANLAANSKAVASGVATSALPNIVTSTFWGMACIGGSGATLALAILAIRSKSKQIKTIGKLSFIPAIFNINEPLIFGLPIMYNASLFIPFVFVMPLNMAINYIATNMGWIGHTFADPSWNMPTPFLAFLSTMDYRALILSFALIALDMLIYYPFFKMFEKEKLNEEATQIEEPNK